MAQGQGIEASSLSWPFRELSYDPILYVTRLIKPLTPMLPGRGNWPFTAFSYIDV